MSAKDTISTATDKSGNACRYPARRALDMPVAEIRRLLDFVTHPEADCGDINR